ncbi:MAG: HD domain-containing phosphohydrolase [Candidatus Omnitrophota bacterium]|nr:HD domain-containing protein [Candidatus Omnitrophota bacterium]
MFRFDDILKKNKQLDRPIPGGAPASNIPETNESADKREDQANIAGQNSQIPNSNFSAIINPSAKKINSDKIKLIYQGLYEGAKKTYQLGNSDAMLINIESSLIFLDDCINGLNQGSDEFLRLCLLDYSDVREFLYYHVVNVCVISLYFGICLYYNQEQLREIGLGAFLHDIGQINYLELINKPDKFTPAEYKTIHNHPRDGVAILNKVFPGLSKDILGIIYQEHERLNATGYPNGLAGEQIIDFARIVSMADVYEALVHRRPYRAKHTPLEAINNILGCKESFDPKITKLLIERIGIFPVGVTVRLSTKEIATVIKGNSGLPLRPTVNIVADANGKYLKEARLLDLAESPVIYIEDCMDYLVK